ncbi:hypothetical protein QQ045_032674 [Rhodiola kirilowii]
MAKGLALRETHSKLFLVLSKLFWRCMRSKPVEEPTEPYTYLDLEPPKLEVKLD